MPFMNSLRDLLHIQRVMLMKDERNNSVRHDKRGRRYEGTLTSQKASKECHMRTRTVAVSIT